MAAKKSKTDTRVDKAFSAVHHEVPRSVADFQRKARAAGADVPEAPKRRKGSKSRD